MGKWARSPLVWGAAVVAVAVLALGLWAFQPWRLYTSTTVDEALPSAGPSTERTGGADGADTDAEDAGNGEGGEQDASGEVSPEEPSEPVVLAEGEFVSQEHETSGTARVLELPDGSRHVRLEDLASSDGPDLYVWLTDQEAGGDWSKYRDGRYVDLGALKGTHGNANYEIPEDADIDGMTSVVIWCDRFSVAFGSAPLGL
ncbi:DM13 domain-containing protein [Nocardiopsis baichengensis]|uniref:DM13 domain-containing protein n=1 Tax=Nocardiopsis baichengensis TaxID=280240 RepID=UPI001EF9CCB9|nr:DM13 domain-containing protein [Nocardiopsis baichengensis]